MSLSLTFDGADINKWRTFDWIINVDPLHVCPGDASLIQRYVLALLYFKTSGDSWKSCSASPDAGSCEGQRFLSDAHECNWGGVACDSSNQVLSLHLDDHNLRGELPTELGLLSQLEEIDMDSNALFGSIPSTLGNLKFLEVVDLDNNGLSGSIPQDLFQATALRVIDLDHNLLTGVLHPDIADLSQLYYFQLDSNDIGGEFPDGFDLLENLKYLSLFNTSLTEPIPMRLCGKGVEILADCDICTIEGCCSACLEG